MLVHHKGLTPERWFRFTLMEQLANVGADVGRAINWKNKNRSEDAILAFERVLELLDLTISDPKNIKRLKEVVRVREFFADYFVCDNIYNFTDKYWQDYFYYFAYAAAAQKGK